MAIELLIDARAGGLVLELGECGVDSLQVHAFAGAEAGPDVFAKVATFIGGFEVGDGAEAGF